VRRAQVSATVWQSPFLTALSAASKRLWISAWRARAGTTVVEAAARITLSTSCCDAAAASMRRPITMMRRGPHDPLADHPQKSTSHALSGRRLAAQRRCVSSSTDLKLVRLARPTRSSASSARRYRAPVPLGDANAGIEQSVGDVLPHDRPPDEIGRQDELDMHPRHRAYAKSPSDREVRRPVTAERCSSTPPKVAVYQTKVLKSAALKRLDDATPFT
jgi:hypothetical protein